LTEELELYTCGLGANYRTCNATDEEVKMPRIADLGQGKAVMGAACGDCHTIIAESLRELPQHPGRLHFNLSVRETPGKAQGGSAPGLSRVLTSGDERIAELSEEIAHLHTEVGQLRAENGAMKKGIEEVGQLRAENAAMRKALEEIQDMAGG
jgi:mono/diheme cytochrome c family protein